MHQCLILSEYVCVYIYVKVEDGLDDPDHGSFGLLLLQVTWVYGSRKETGFVTLSNITVTNNLVTALLEILFKHFQNYFSCFVVAVDELKINLGHMWVIFCMTGLSLVGHWVNICDPL